MNLFLLLAKCSTFESILRRTLSLTGKYSLRSRDFIFSIENIATLRYYIVVLSNGEYRCI